MSHHSHELEPGRVYALTLRRTVERTHRSRGGRYPRDAEQTIEVRADHLGPLARVDHPIRVRLGDAHVAAGWEIASIVEAPTAEPEPESAA